MSISTTTFLQRGARRLTAAAIAVAALNASMIAPAQARGPSDASIVASMLPVAVSVAIPAVVLGVGVGLTVKAIESTATGTVWVLERASDGVKVSVRFVGKVVTGAALSVGTAVVVSAVTTGYILSAAGEAIAFIPNEIGASLLHNERVTRKDEVVR